MTRVILSAAFGFALAGCASWLPGFEGGYVSELRLESEPPGAEVQTSGGQTCRTPCSLAVAASGEFSVTFTHEGYLPQTVPVQVRLPGDPRADPNAASTVQLVPNPVAVALEAAPPPPAKRKPVRRAAPRPAAAAAPARSASPASVAEPEPEPSATPMAPPRNSGR